MADLSVYGKLRGFSDYQRANEEFQLKKQLQQAQIAEAQAVAANPMSKMPSAIQEYNLFKTMTTDEQQQYLLVKRASPYLNTGGAFIQPSPVTGAPINTIPITPKVTDMPEFQKEQERSKALGDIQGKAEGSSEKKTIQAPEIERQLKLAEELLPKATSGGASTNIRDVGAYFGKSTEGSKIDSRLNVIGAALTSSVPRMEGPQGVYDVKLYEQAAGELANSKLPFETRLAAITTMRDLNNKYMNNQTQPTGGDDGAAAEQVNQPSKNLYQDVFDPQGVYTPSAPVNLTRPNAKTQAETEFQAAKYKTPEDVRTAYKAGKISKEVATGILSNKHGFEQ
jgi:hypothetical protein